MKKRNKMLILILIIIILCATTVFCINIFNKGNKTDTQKKISDEKIEYYRNIHEKMYKYYKIVYKNMNVPIENKNSTIRINLGTLKNEGFPIDEFISFDGKYKCDIALSYALRKVVNSKYSIEVYYKCGPDANYDYTKNVKEEITSKNTTTKKSSISKEEFEANKPINKPKTTEAINE